METELKACDISTEKCIEWYFPENYKMALAIAMAESKLNPKAVGYNCVYGQNIRSCDVSDRGRAVTKDYSIFQINNYYHPGSENFTVEENISYARKMYLKGGWVQWSVYNSGSYLKYLDYN